MSLANRITLPFAFFGLVLLVACGTNGNPNPNNNGYTNTDFSGTYVFSFLGTDANAESESFFAIAGTATADGNGNITGGTVDINDANLGGVFTAQALSASTYSVGSDGRGSGTLVTPEGTFGIDFVLTSDSHGLISRFDNTGSGSGTMDIQGSATQGSLTSLAFSLFGSDADFDNFGTVGAFTLNGSGTITPAGVEDFNDNGSSAGITSQSLTGSLVLSSSTNGTAVFTTPFVPGGLTFDVWVVDSSHLKLIETDTTSGFAVVGDAFPQQTSFTGGQLVFTLAGADSGDAPLVAGGFVTTDVNGNLSEGIEDYNDAGTTNSISPFSGTCNATAPFVGDRCQLALTAFGNGIATNLTFAAYPSASGVLLLEDDSAGFLQGGAFAQTATAFGSPENYGLNLSGFNTTGVADGEVDDIAEFNTTTGTSNNMTGVLDENDIDSALISSSLLGTYTADSPATGRGSMSISTPLTYLTGLTLEYYVLDNSSTLFIEQDSNQLSMGLFELQSSPGSDVSKSAHKAGAQSAAIQSIVSLVRPFGKKNKAVKHLNQK
jgi:hypothetical protein